ncbi:MAG: hypothetical protein ACI3YB_02145 [Prevotella sp.]
MKKLYVLSLAVAMCTASLAQDGWKSTQAGTSGKYGFSFRAKGTNALQFEPTWGGEKNHKSKSS